MLLEAINKEKCDRLRTPNYLDALEASSSRGPSSDGRVKPDICANGAGQLSTDGPNDYQVGGGTSAACPGIAGIVTQLHHAYRELNGGANAEQQLSSKPAF